MTIKAALLGLTLASALATPGIAHANIETCSFAVLDSDGQPTYDVQKVEYFHAPNNFNTYAWRCDWDTGRCSLSGWLISPKKANGGNLPAIVFEHGSAGASPLGDLIEDDQSLTSYSCPIKRFVDAGYVVFMPYRRGTFDKTAAATLPFAARSHPGWSNWSNSGWNAQDYAVWSVDNAGVDMNIDNYDGQYIAYLDAEVGDLVDVIQTLDQYVRPDMTAKLIDPTRVAIAGHSMGGAFTTFAGTDDDLHTKLAHGPRAFISLSGAAMSYHESFWWHDQLTASAAINNAPLYFTRALDEDARVPNDFASAREPFAETNNGADGSGMALFSPVNASCPSSVTSFQCNHTAFVTNSDQIDRWFPYVKRFLGTVGM